MSQVHRTGETRCVVLGDSQVGDPELHARRTVVGAHRGDPRPRGFPVGQRHGQRHTGPLEAHRGRSVDRRHLQPANLGADSGGTRGDRQGRIGHRPVEVDLQPLPQRGLQRVGHPRGGRIGVHRRHRGAGRCHRGQGGGIRGRTRGAQPPARPRTDNKRGTGHRIVGYPVESVTSIAGGTHRRRVVIDAAVVGLPVYRGIGHDDPPTRRCRQPGTVGVGGQQHRSQRLLAEQAASFVDAQQRLRTAGDTHHRIGGREIWPTGVEGTGGADPVDLHRGKQRAQTAVADEALDGARPDRFAEFGHLRQSG